MADIFTSEQVWAPANYVSSISTGTVKADSGILKGVWGTTAGVVALKDGAVALGLLTVSAGIMTAFPEPGLRFNTSLTVSASAAVATYLIL